jgi:fructose-1,6-bisphosphatase I
MNPNESTTSRAASKRDAKHLHNTNPKTLSRFMLEASSVGDASNTDLALIVNAISVSAKIIANAVAVTGIDSLHTADGHRAHDAGDEQKELDKIAHDVMVNALASSQRVAIMASEEHADPIFCKDTTGKHSYAVAFDPLDGSSNIECNVSVGTIFGIYRCASAEPKMKDFLRNGSDLVCAGYVLYSSSVIIVLSTGVEVHSFTLDPTFGEFIESANNPIKIPEDPRRIYSINAGNSETWDRPTTEFVTWTKQQDQPYSLRYIGSMVSDVHRTILYGGIFMYPADSRNTAGKLRLLYECFPMAFLVEAAGGVATDGRSRILDLVPADLHERSAIFMGCRRDVEALMSFYTAAGATVSTTDVDTTTATTATAGGGGLGLEGEHATIISEKELKLLETISEGNAAAAVDPAVDLARVSAAPSAFKRVRTISTGSDGEPLAHSAGADTAPPSTVLWAEYIAARAADAAADDYM